MKENAILKINTMGKIAGIITLIAKILIGIGMAGCLMAAIAFAVIPKDFMTMKIAGNALIDIDLGVLGISENEINASELQMNQEELARAGASGTLDMYGAEYYLKSMTVNGTCMQIDAVAEDLTLNLHGLSVVMMMGLLNLAMMMVSLFFIGALCKAFRNCVSPFEENVIKKMQYLAISLVPWAFMSSITDMFRQSYFTGKIQLGIAVDMGTVVTILLVFVLVYIFKYGAVLQQESDETL